MFFSLFVQGYDADVVIWNRNPLELGAKPLATFIDVSNLPKTYIYAYMRNQTNHFNLTLQIIQGYKQYSIPFSAEPAIENPPVDPLTPHLPDEKQTLETYTVTNISEIYTDRGLTQQGSLVVENGLVTCLGGSCTPKGSVFDLKGGVVIPGLVATNLHLGLFEIDAEESTSEGSGTTQDAISGRVQAVDGLRVGGGSKRLLNAYRGGVLTAVSVPGGSGLVLGQSVGFRTGAELYREAVVKPIVALHVRVGHHAKNEYAPSVAVQFARLRELLYNSTSGPFFDVKIGKYPLVVNADDPNDISKMISFTYDPLLNLKLIIAGGIGSWVVAKELAGKRKKKTP
jgi:hypothetical protein